MKKDAFEVKAFVFESREMYEQAKKDEEIICDLQKNLDLSDWKKALKTYNRLVMEKTFSTVVGYGFLMHLRDFLVTGNLVKAEDLVAIPVKGVSRNSSDLMPQRPQKESRYKGLYEKQKIKNKKMKIILTAVLIFFVTAVVITARTDYSVFTYFTNYKTQMEEEIINKYEQWEAELQEREDALNQK